MTFKENNILGGDAAPETEGRRSPAKGRGSKLPPKRPAGVRDPFRRIRKGAGVGEGLAYSSPLRVGDFSSLGSAQRVSGLTIRREYHLMAGGERGYFLMADFDPRIVDIREQFYLLPVEETATIASELGIRHPRDRHGLTPLSIDLLLTFKDGRVVALEIKNDLKALDRRINPRNCEIHDIKKIWWAARGIDFLCVYNRGLDPRVVDTLQWLQGPGKQEDRDNPVTVEQLEGFTKAFAEAWNQRRTLRQTLSKMGVEPTFEQLRLFRRSVWAHLISIDLTRTLALNESVRLVKPNAYRRLMPW